MRVTVNFKTEIMHYHSFSIGFKTCINPSVNKTLLLHVYRK